MRTHKSERVVTLDGPVCEIGLEPVRMGNYFEWSMCGSNSAEWLLQLLGDYCSSVYREPVIAFRDYTTCNIAGIREG